MHAASLALLALTLTLLDAAAVGAAKRKPCGDTSWVVEDAPILPDDASLQATARSPSAAAVRR
jgi:hypothetical protein